MAHIQASLLQLDAPLYVLDFSDLLGNGHIVDVSEVTASFGQTIASYISTDTILSIASQLIRMNACTPGDIPFNAAIPHAVMMMMHCNERIVQSNKITEGEFTHEIGAPFDKEMCQTIFAEDQATGQICSVWGFTNDLLRVGLIC